MSLDFFLHNKASITGTHYKTLDQARSRIFLVTAVLLMGFLAVTLRLVDLTVLGPSAAAQAPAEAGLRPLQKPLRGEIVDRNGALLATSLKMASLFVDATLVADPQKTAKDLVRIIPDLNYGETLQKLQAGKKFQWIRRNITPRQQYAINLLGEPALGFQEEDRRIYPYGNLMAHIVGYTDVDGHGIAGVEKAFDGLLQKGGDVAVSLTIDARVQHILRSQLQSAMKKFSAKGAMGIVMDVHTGEILAMTSLPDFDPLYPGDAGSEAIFNRATLGVYEMGSTFKLFTVAAALENGMGYDASFDAASPIKIGRHTIGDYHAKNRVMTLPEVFIFSSNIGTARMAERVGTDKMQAFFNSLGFFESVPVELPERGAPILPRPWREVSTYTTAYGHGISVSALHVARAAAAAVNGGILPVPTLIRKEGEAQAQNGKRVISPQTSARLRELLRLTVAAGTGNKARVEGYDVGGKTGSAEKSAGGGYNKKALLSSFIGAFPLSDPKYVVLAILDEPQGTKETYGYATAGWTAAPVVSGVIERMAPLLGMMPVANVEQETRARFAPYVKEIREERRKLAAVGTDE